MSFAKYLAMQRNVLHFLCVMMLSFFFFNQYGVFCCTNALWQTRKTIFDKELRDHNLAVKQQWLLVMFRSAHRQDQHQRGPYQAASESCLHSFIQGTMPPLQLFAHSLLPLLSSLFLYLSLPMCLFLSLFLFAPHTHTHTHTHTHQQSSLPLCAECVVEPPVHQAGKPA